MTQHALVCAIALLIFLTLFFLSRMRGLGFGDVVLGGILALHAGYPWSLLMFQLAAAGSLVYIFLIQGDRRAPAPLGAFFALAFFRHGGCRSGLEDPDRTDMMNGPRRLKWACVRKYDTKPVAWTSPLYLSMRV